MSVFTNSHRVALVSCVKSKSSTASAARELYTSPLFQSLRGYAESNADAWYILSAQYGLVSPNQVIDPYEKTLNQMRKPERITWANRVQEQLLAVLPAAAAVTMLAGLRYRENLVPFLRSRGFPVRIPLEGLSFGLQLQHLKALRTPS